MTAALVAADPGQPYVSPDDLSAIPGLWAQAVGEHIRPVIAEIYLGTEGAVHAQMVEAVGVGLPNPGSLAAETYLAGAVNTMTEVVGEDLWDTARTQLLEGFQAGESIDELAGRLRGAADLAARNATLLARTVVLDASNAASIATARATGIPMRKGWLDTPDTRTRETHRAAGAAYGTDDQMIDLEAKFVVGGFDADRPHDPLLPAEERYNCRCTLVYSVGDADAPAAGEPLPNTSGVADLESDARAAAAGEGMREQLAGGSVGTVERVTLPNGRELFGKESSGWHDRPGEEVTDAEELASLLGRAIGAPVPRVVRDGPRHIYTDWALGEVGSNWFDNPSNAYFDGPADNDFLLGVVDSGPGRRLGLFDLLTQNQDRHAANWLLTADGTLTGIDHGVTWWFDEFSAPQEWLAEGQTVEPGEPVPFEQVVRGGLQGPFVRGRWFDQDQLEDTGLAVPVDTDMWTPQDVAETRRRLRALRGQFDRLGHGDWLDYSLRVLDLLGPYAKGTRSIFDG